MLGLADEHGEKAANRSSYCSCEPAQGYQSGLVGIKARLIALPGEKVVCSLPARWAEAWSEHVSLLPFMRDNALMLVQDSLWAMREAAADYWL